MQSSSNYLVPTDFLPNYDYSHLNSNGKRSFDAAMPKRSYEYQSIWSARTVENEQTRDHLINKWMKHCLEHHDDCLERDLADIYPQASNILLVDVEGMCLIEATTAEHYVALSYVWGKNTVQFETVLEKFESLLKPGSLNQVWGEISKAIQDAINLAKEIGAPFLWCDTLCILQDDYNGTKPEQLNLMAEIYNRAMATLIAVHGENANTALVRKPFLANQPIRKPFKTQPILKKIEDSTYCTRGWCYQERLLTKRRIYFMEDEAIFHCRQDLFTSNPYTAGVKLGREAHSEYKTYYPNVMDRIDRAHERGHGSEWPNQFEHGYNAYHHFFTKVVEDFSAKDLTNPNDILDACSGIISALQGQTSWPFLAGIPLSLLPMSLMWTPRVDPDAELDTMSFFRRRLYKIEDQRLDCRFPSWSWVGWHGPVTFMGGPGALAKHVSMLREIHIYSDQAFEKDEKTSAKIRQHDLRALERLGKSLPALGKCMAVLGFETYAVPLSRLFRKPLFSPSSNVYHLTAADPNSPSDLKGHPAGILYGTYGDQWHMSTSDNATYELVLLAKTDVAIYESFPEAPENWEDLFPLDSQGDDEDDNESDEKDTEIMSVNDMSDKSSASTMQSQPKPQVDMNLLVEKSVDEHPNPMPGGNVVIKPGKDDEVYDVLLVKSVGRFAERAGVGQVTVGIWNSLSPVQKQILLR